jgi:uncharacterized membrane protein
MSEDRGLRKIWNTGWIALLVFGLIAIAGIYVHTRLWTPPQHPEKYDIYYSYLEGSRLVEGANPYRRIMQSDMRTNDKYATYFPLFYLLSALTQRAGLESYLSWLAFWRVVFLICNLGIGFLIFQICAEDDQAWLGIFGAAFWLFNRWTVDVTAIDHLDFLPLFLLLLSLKLVPRRFWWACLLFSFSLAIKQIAILALPLYLIWAWQMEGEKRWRHLVQAGALIAAIPLVTSVPFLVWNAQAYLKSILFSATRNPEDHFSTPSIDVLLGMNGLPARIPMFVLAGLTYALAFFRHIPKYSALLLIMAIIFGFNSVLYRQYLTWLIPFIPLAVLEATRVAKPHRF